MRTCQNCHREFEQASDNRCPHCGVLLVNLSKRSIDDKKLRGAKPKTPPDDEPVEIDLDELLAMEELTDTNQGGQTIELSHFVADDDDLPEVDPDDITPLSVPDLPPLSHQTLAEQEVTQADTPSVDPDDDLVLGEAMSLDEIEEASFGPSEDIPVGPTIELDDFLNLDDEEPVVDIEDMTPLDTSSHESVLDDDDEPAVDADDVTPLEFRDEPVVKTPTVADRNDMTMEFQSMPAGGGEPAQPSTKRPTHTPESDQTIDISAMQRPTGRSTHSLEADKTIDLSMSPAEASLLDSQWRGTIEHGTRQGQTIRQRETIPGFRSSLPVKSRYVREKRKEGAEPPRSLAEVPDYELLDIIGEGGMGVVYAAHQSSIARTVAVKMLKPSAKVREEQRDKFISEAVVTGELDHPNIVPIYDLGSNDEGALFYSMKRVRGTPWDKVIHQKSLDENVGILMRVADAVAFAHAGGVIHRDLKPENVMLGDYGEVLVMDWGLARITPEFAHVNAVFQADSLGGTPAYMSPEMAKGPVEAINKTSDIYLLGAILYEIIGGQPPHSGRDVMQCLMSASQNRIDPNRYDGELKSIALKAMATQQADRYQTVKELQEAIRVYQSHSESLVLTANANQNLQKARAANDYPLYARALYGFQESLTLWDENHRAQLLLTETQRDYATCALGKGDLDLAASLLDSSHDEHQPIIKQIDEARAERDARQRRLRLAKFAVAALLAIVVTTISVAAFIANNLRGKAVVARNEAEQQKGIAVQQRGIAEEQKTEADKQRTVAVEQKGIAEKEKVEADKQRAAAVEQKGIAEQQKVEADKQRTVAVEQKGIAETQRQKAEDAKKAEEYEAYIAQIGLANAKINENAYDFALQLLNGVKPELRNWEWGRLEHLCKLGSANYKADGAVDAVAYSPDGKTFVTGDKSGKVTLRDADTGNIRWQVAHGQYVLAVDYSANGRYIATGSNDKTIQILDAATGRNLRTLAGHTDGVLTVRFSPDGKQLLSGSYDNTARLWNIAAGTTVQELKGHSWWVWAAEFSPKGDRIVTAGQDGKAIVWQREGARGEERGARLAESPPQTRASLVAPGASYTQLTTFTGHDGAVYSARFSPDGKQVATGGYDKLVMIWNPDEVHPVNIGRRLEGKPDEKLNYIKLAGHDEPVRSVSFSPNGQLLLSGSEDHSVRVWDVALGKAVKALRGHGRSVRACEFSPDGKWALSGGDDESVRVWNVAGYQEMRVLHATVFSGHEDAVLSARYSRDGQQIITASRDRTASRWRADNGAPIMRYEEGHEFLVSGAVFFPDGKRLATGAGDNSVRIWDLTAGIQSAVLSPTGRIGTLAVSPDGNWLVTGSNGSDVKLWNPQTGEARGELTGHGAEVTALMFSRDGQRLASGDDRGRVRIWHLENRAPAQAGGAFPQGWVFERELDGHTGSITALHFTPDGRRLVTASGDHSCGQWDVASGQEQRQLVLKHDDYVSSLDMSPDGTRALTACDDGSVRLWRLADATQLAAMKSPSKPFTSVAFSPDGSAALLTSSESKKVWRWDLSLLNAIRGSTQLTGATPQPGVQPNAAAQGTLTQLIDFKTLGGEVWASEFAPDGQHILTIGGNDAQLWNLSTMRPVVRYSPHGAVASAALSPDGKLIATGSWDHSAKIWDAATGHAVRKLDGGHKGYINSVEFSSDGSELLTASDDTNALIWNVATGKPTGTVFHGHTARLLSATFSPDGKYILTASGDKTAKIWNRTGGEAVRTLPGHTWAVLCAKFSADGKRAITGSQDADAWIWDVDTGNVLVKLRGHTAPVTAVAFSPDGTRVLTGSQDNTAKLWDAATGKEILSLPGHSQEVTSVSFSPDGRNVLTSSRDGTAIIWLANDWHKVEANVANATH